MTDFGFGGQHQLSNCRGFVCREKSTVLGRGFRTKAEASDWIDAFGVHLDWRAGFAFQLKGDATALEIVNHQGNVAKV